MMKHVAAAPARLPTTRRTSGSRRSATRSGPPVIAPLAEAALVGTGRALAPPAARHPGRLRRQGPRIRAAADERAELGGPPHGRLPAARVRRRRGAEGAGAAADRHRAARPARGGAGPDAERQRRSVADPAAGARRPRPGGSRETLLTELHQMRDERAAPLFCYLVRHMDRRKESAAVHRRRSTRSARSAAPDAVEALKFALHQGDWLVAARERAACGRRRRRRCAGSARRRPSTCCARRRPRGPRGVRAAARAELSRST